jgi:hypothetical protein
VAQAQSIMMLEMRMMERFIDSVLYLFLQIYKKYAIFKYYVLQGILKFIYLCDGNLIAKPRIL